MPFGGGGSTPGGSSAGLLLPPGQAQAAGQLQPIVQPMADQSVNALNALNGMSPAQSAYPFVQGAASSIINNPFQGAAVQGGQDASSLYYNQFLPNAFTAQGMFDTFGNLAYGQAGGPIAAMNNPAYDKAAAVGGDVSGLFQSAAGQLLSDAFNPNYRNAVNMGGQLSGPLYGAESRVLGDVFAPQYEQAINIGQQAAPQLTGAASSILGTAFDPQRDLYHRTQSQISDQVGAQLANSGLGDTPYGASVTGNTLSNFNIDWQNNLLNRMTQGGQAASGLDLAAIQGIVNPSQAATSAAATDVGAGVNAGQGALSMLLNPSLAATTAAQGDVNAAGGAASTALSSLLQPAASRSAAQVQGASALGNLGSTVNNLFGSGLNALNSAAQGASTFGAAPYNAANAVQGNNFGALQNEISLGNQNYVVPQQTIGDLMQYLGLGQSASGLANSIGSTNFNQGMQSAQGLGSLFGTGANLLGGGGGGIGGLFGGGLGGGLAQGASGAASLGALAADPAIFASDVGASFGGGGGGILSSILPFAAS